MSEKFSSVYRMSTVKKQAKKLKKTNWEIA